MSLGSAIWALGLLGLAGLYAPVLSQMARIWWTDTYAAHGVFVPAFSALLLWMDRARLRGVPRRNHPAGIAVILLGLGLLAVGRSAGSLSVEGLSVVIAVVGLVLWGFGDRFLRAVAFPVGFLVLMVPVPRPLIGAVTLHLQLFASGAAGAALGLLDVPFYQHGVVIELPSMTLLVAEVCNGLRFLLALVVLTVAFAQVSQRTLARKVVLVLSAIPIAILANALRVAVVAVGVHYIGPEMASGFIHHSIGKVVWVLTLVPLVGIGFYLRRRGPSEARDASSVRGAGVVAIREPAAEASSLPSRPPR